MATSTQVSRQIQALANDPLSQKAIIKALEDGGQAALNVAAAIGNIMAVTSDPALALTAIPAIASDVLKAYNNIADAVNTLTGESTLPPLGDPPPLPPNMRPPRYPPSTPFPGASPAGLIPILCADISPTDFEPLPPEEAAGKVMAATASSTGLAPVELLPSPPSLCTFLVGAPFSQFLNTKQTATAGQNYNAAVQKSAMAVTSGVKTAYSDFAKAFTSAIKSLPL